jgi:hypothetical protein
MSAQPRWEHTESHQRPVRVPATATRGDPDRNAARVVSLIALASIAAGAINVAAAATIGRHSAQNLAFFGVVGAAQLTWGAVALFRAPRWWLALGAVGNLVVVATWAASRTVGLPVGVYAGITLPVGFPDTLAAILEAVTVVGAVALIIKGRGPARSAARASRVTLAAAVLVGALALVGVLSQTGAIGSSPAGSGGHGAGVGGPYAPGSGTGSSNGGSSGSGYPGY